MNGSADSKLPSRSTPYTRLHRLGEGATGNVDLAIENRTGRRVALKRFHDDSPSVLSEASLLAGIRHPGIVGLLDAFVEAHDDGRTSLVAAYEYVAGEDLVAATRQSKLEVKLDRFAEAMRALAFLHRRSVLHRDLKPANILIRRDLESERTVLLDFGFAAHARETTGLRGTLRYLAPELIDGSVATERTDLFAMGVVLHELLTGVTPSHGLDAIATMRLHAAEGLSLPEHVAATAPVAIRELCTQLLRADPGRRLASADEALELLERAGHRDLGGAEELTARIRSLEFGDGPLVERELVSRISQTRRSVVLCVPDGSNDAITRLRIEFARAGFRFGGTDGPIWHDLRDGCADDGTLADLAEQQRVMVVDADVALPDELRSNNLDRVAIARPDEECVLAKIRAELGIDLPRKLLPSLAAIDGFTPASVRAGLLHLMECRVIRSRAGRVSCEPFRPVSVRQDARWTPVAGARVRELPTLEREWVACIALAEMSVARRSLAHRWPALGVPAASTALERLIASGIVSIDGDDRVSLVSHAFTAAARLELSGGDADLARERTIAVSRAMHDDAGIDPVRRGISALALAPYQPSDAAIELLDVGRELRIAGRAAEAGRFLEPIGSVLRDHVTPDLLKTAARWMADTASFLGDDARAESGAKQALAIAASSPSGADDDARCRAVLARCALRRGEPSRAREEIEAGLAIGGASSSTRAVIESLSSLASRRLSRLDEALMASQRAITAAGDAPSAELAGAWMELANTLDDRGDTDRAIEAYRRARDVGEAIGRSEVFAHAASNLGRSLLLRGESGTAIEWFESAVRGFEAAAAPALAEGAWVNLLWAQNSIGDLDGARATVLRARSAFGRGSSLPNRAMFLRHAAETEWRCGNRAAAERLLRESIDLRRRFGSTAVVACGEAQLARLFALRGDERAARGELARAMRGARRESNGLPDCEVLAVAAEYHALWGRPERAARLVARALRLERSLRPARFDAVFHGLAAIAAWRRGDDFVARRSVENGLETGSSEAANAPAALLFAIRSRLLAESEGDRAEAGFADALARVVAPGFAFERALVTLLRGGARFERGAALAGARNPDDVRRSLDELAKARSDADSGEALLRGLGFETTKLALASWRSRMATSETIGSAGSGFAGLDRRMRGMERLLEINKAINSELDPHRLLELILDSAISLCAARRGFCVLVRGNQVEVKVARNFSQQDVAHPEFEISHSVARGVARSGEPILTSNALSDSRLRSIASIHELRLLSILCVPLRSRNEILGSIYLDHPDLVDRFDQVDLALLTDFAWAAGIALERARLYQENLDRTRELLVAKQENERLNAELLTRVKEQQVELVDAQETIEAERSVQALRYDYRTIVTRCERMRDVLRLIDRITETAFPVLIRGESGTGKELVARAIHYNGPRAEKNFVAVNCAAMTESLIESVLFGYVKGAFTGADRDRKGLFEVAHEGTLFLDEIGDMTLEVQKRLLRVLQYGEFYRIGAKDSIKVDVRVLCATHRDVRAMIPAGLFRQDLYYRISVAEVNLPALREREGDVRLLIDHVIAESTAAGQPPPCHFSPAALRVLEGYSWPGNIRELQNEVKRLLFLRTERPTVDVADLPPYMLTRVEPDEPRARDGANLKDQLAAVEQAIVSRALRDASGNKSEAARRLGISIRGLYKILERGRDEDD